jgi:hypothetical protein
MRSLQRCYKQDRSRVQLVVKHSLASKDVNTEVDASTALEAVIRQLVKTQQSKKA